jgi:hypothetical protein
MGALGSNGGYPRSSFGVKRLRLRQQGVNTKSSWKFFVSLERLHAAEPMTDFAAV